MPLPLPNFLHENEVFSQSIIGVAVAIAGNVLISIALNIQKLAHNELRKSAVALKIDPSGELSRIDCDKDDKEVSYIYSPLWWAGIAVMILGELGNFLAYGFAPAVLVAPLGTVALISNILIAPIFLGERIRNEDLYGIASSTVGTFIILAVSSNTEEPSLSADDILAALTQLNFGVYVAATLISLVVLYRYSSSEVGEKYILVDLLIAGLLGGYTVLSIKALSSLLKLNMYTILSHWITYVAILTLVITGVGQIHFLSKALSRFNSTEVIPTNFVIFTTCSIVASAILYNDLSRTSPFALLGVVFMFAGVVLITFKKQPALYSPLVVEEVVVEDVNEEEVVVQVEDFDVPTTPPTMIPPLFISSPHREHYNQITSPLSSFDRDPTPASAYRRLSGFITSVGGSVGTHSVRRMEFDHMTSPSRKV